MTPTGKDFKLFCLKITHNYKNNIIDTTRMSIVQKKDPYAVCDNVENITQIIDEAQDNDESLTSIVDAVQLYRNGDKIVQ